jgi:DNA-directed RNA polymerase subunit RPC12/RpoP
LLVLVALVVVALVARQQLRPRSDRVYRPRASPFGRRPQGAGGDANWVASRSDVEGVRDAYSSATLDPDRALYRCGGCQAWYHDGSVEALQRENAGRCALCGSADLREVRIV